MSKLSREDILKLASLSKLHLTEEQVEKFRTELAEIMEYVEQLGNADVTGLEPTNQVTGLKNVTRPDEAREYASQAELLKNLPEQEGNLIKVKRVLE